MDRICGFRWTDNGGKLGSNHHCNLDAGHVGPHACLSCAEQTQRHTRRRSGSLMKRLALAFTLLGGCAAQGLDAGTLPGTWTLSKGSVIAEYTFRTDGEVAFDGGASAAGTHAHLQGVWVADTALLTLAFDEHPTVSVPYAIDGDKLTIVDDPATVRVGAHLSVVYTRAAVRP